MATDDHRMEREARPPPFSGNAEFVRHTRWLRTVVASRVSERDAIEDILQQIGLAAAHAELRPQTPNGWGPWLYRVAVRQCLLHRRTAGRRRRKLRRFAEGASESNGLETSEPLDWLLQAERQTAVREALARLGDIDRQVLLLKYTENWTYTQLASQLGVTVHTVEYRLLQARDRLRRALANLGVVEASL